MSTEESKHGTWAGYQRGCREDCCTSAARNYQKRRTYDASQGRPRMVSSLGSERRIQALQALGWDRETIGAHLGHSRAWVQQVLRGNPFIWRKTAEKIAAVYDDLSMRLPPADDHRRRIVVSRTRNMAKRNGWLPPLAWDDIDDPDERPSRPEKVDGRKTVHLIIEDAEWLADSDLSLSAVCERLDINRDTFRDILRREGRSDLYWRLANREPDADTRRAVSRGIKRSREVA